MKRLLFIALLVVFGCDELTNNNHEDEVEIVFNLEPRLDQDENGYYHLELNPLTFQTIHRLSGHIYGDGQPLDVVRFNWESSHYWTIGDTMGYIVHQGLTDDLVYVSYDTTYITGFSDFIVPTINCCSYSNSDGEVNTMFAPVWHSVSPVESLDGINEGYRNVLLLDFVHGSEVSFL